MKSMVAFHILVLAAVLLTPTDAKALLPGSPNPPVNMTEGLIGYSQGESETAALPLDVFEPGFNQLWTFGHVVAYNSADTTPGHFTGTKTCVGNSQSALSYDLSPSPVILTGTVSKGIRFPTPNKIAILAGDPGIAIQAGTDPGSTAWTVFVSSLAVSMDAWGATNCIPSLELPNPDQVCVSAVSIPKDGTSPPSLLPNAGWCVGGSTNFDGTTLTSNNGNVYLASWDNSNSGGSLNGIMAWMNGTALTPPFGSKNMKGHPKWATNAYFFPTLVAPDKYGVFFVSSYNGTNLIQFPTPINSGEFSWTANVTIGALSLREDGYDAVVTGVPFVVRNLFLFFTVQSAGVTQIQTATCTLFDNGGNGGTPLNSCQVRAGSRTSAGSNSFLPSADVDISSGKIWLTFWSNTPGQGMVQMVAAKVSPTDGSITNVPATGVSEIPCPSGQYWGDYDSLIIGHWGNVSTLLRYVTDSTDGACNNGLPQHVTVLFGNGQL